MNINDDQSFQSDTDSYWQFTSDQLDQVFNLSVELVSVVDKTVILGDSLFNSNCPIDLIDGQNNLARPSADPLITSVVDIISKRLAALRSESLTHDRFNFKHPLFDVALFFSFVHINWLVELNNFTFR